MQWVDELRMSMISGSLVVLGAAMFMSCQDAATDVSSSTVLFSVESDPGVGVVGASVLIDGMGVGVSDEHGMLTVVVKRRLGQRLIVEHVCPDGYRNAPAPKPLTLRRFQAVTSDTLPIEITLQCRPEKRIAVFVIRSNSGPGLPVLLDGKAVSLTNFAGVAHFSVLGEPGTEYLVKLDTSGRPRLTPQFPSHQLLLPDAHEIFVVNQLFDFKEERRGRLPRRIRITKIE
jgi:hypothetical protein